MPHFYIDTSDQARFIQDRDGLAFEDVEAAMDAAAGALSDMAHDVLPCVEDRVFMAIVRDTRGRTLGRATMSFAVTWMTDPR